MHQSFKKAARTLQSSFPIFKPAKDDFYYLYRRLLAKPHDRDFGAIALLDKTLSGDYVDVGANHGQSIESIRLFQPGVHIVAFEPNPALADKLCRRYAGDQRVEIRPLGLADTPGEMTLFSPSYRGFDYDGLASLDYEAALNWLNPERVYFYDPRRLQVRKIECRISTLDSENLAPIFLKIDVQGFEYNVLLGGVESLKKFEPIVLTEDYHGDPRSSNLMQSLGFEEYFYDGSSLRRGPSPGSNSFLMTPARARSVGM